MKHTTLAGYPHPFRSGGSRRLIDRFDPPLAAKPQAALFFCSHLDQHFVKGHRVVRHTPLLCSWPGTVVRDRGRACTSSPDCLAGPLPLVHNRKDAVAETSPHRRGVVWARATRSVTD